MLKFIFTLAFILVGTGSFAQEKLSLETSVMQQYRRFAPDRLTMANWIPGTKEYRFPRELHNAYESKCRQPYPRGGFDHTRSQQKTKN